MSARLHFRPEFLEDFDHHREYLVGEGRLDWLENLYSALARVRTLLARFPAAGTPVRRDERYVLREWLLPANLPYLVQYVHRVEDPIRDVWFVRLWHEGQQRKLPDLSGWPWSS